MSTRPSLTLAALLICTGCASSSSVTLPPPPSDPPSCPAPAYAPCPPPAAPLDGQTLGVTEATDAENRARWLVCIERHNAWLECATRLIERGYLAAPSTPKPEKGIDDE